MNLFIDTTNWKLIYLLEKDNQIIDSLIILNNKKLSDIAILKLEEFLKNNNLTLNDLKAFYLTIGPGSYTGVRVGLTIVKTLKVLNNNFDVFIINSLLYQAGLNKIISCIDARSNKYYVSVYNNAKQLLEISLIDQDQINNLINQYQDFKLVNDYQFDYLKHYLDLKKHFIKIDDDNKLNPLYIKNFI
ncbi:tRNA (adenosine(37)-N6)-threonylcarbamoyltransferase complex dimerization subunit type 1 TsaB [Mycoplasma mycoides]|uniref:tRNA (adenosine(37)-N6)-threonylcarbamoyltransferase complex dimerization subunit type 1 TsaB n=1 Tax=Mycoplasma mycoides TaxID=2102 RepID=UPI0022401C0B|nr:tRNA (adenosine(37)-N6)-threonylcarbamoyltransferase complex dimerization subunit type 1 TsaB [Mycoplasma mycoides]QVK08772.1 tRNA (adenosine(37)-N6)-threonylcarbamoyltransferase complex dimerization subunit type 1 TsaB [Mycoplasma mycoides subsp. capri]